MKDALGNVQSVLVLGGDSDIGFHTCRQLVKQRTRKVLLAGRDRHRLESRATQLNRDSGVETICLEFDALDFDSHDRFVDEVFEAHRDIDLVLLAFGVLGDQQQGEAEGSKAIDVIQANFTGAVSVLTPVARCLKAQGHGTIVVLSSVAAERPRKSNFIYGASKAGLDWFAQGLSYALEGSGVSVLIVRPGFSTTKMTRGIKTPPLASTPEEVASAIIDGLRSNKNVIWVPRQLRFVMAVLRLLPRSLFRRLSI